MEVALLKNIILALIVICAIWIFRIVVKKEYENLVRTGLILVLLLLVFVFLQKTEAERITMGDVGAQIRNTFFPEKAPNYIYEKEDGVTQNRPYTRYYFEVPGPQLSLVMDPKTQYFDIKNVYSVNRILDYLGLPKVKTAVPELASVTGSRNDINLYRWDDYPLGTLIIERGICQDRERIDSYQCIVSIMVLGR
jgi:uncharacterized MnhB-related membrane protein